MRRITRAATAAAAGLAVAVSVASVAGRGRAPAGQPPAAAAADQAAARRSPGPGDRVPARALSRGVVRAYAFLSQMMNRYATGPTPRLVQSFTGGPLGREHDTSSDVYDDALIIDAYLAAGTRAGRSRAEVIGNALLYAQAHDPRRDGRLRAAYAPVPLLGPGSVKITDAATPAGDMAWAGQALAQLYGATGIRRYLRGAEAIGNWVQAHCYDPRGAGGYTGGEAASGQKIEWKSTEHNIDLYGLFSLLAAQTRDPVWAARAAAARRFIKSMWDPAQGAFDVGTIADGVAPNETEPPEDINSWSYLALRDPVYGASVTWNVLNLTVSAGGFAGVSYCSADRSGVWFEGTAHLADALETRDEPGDEALAARYLADLYYAQAHGPDGDGGGIMAASKNGLSDCAGGLFYTSLHTGATAWYILAARRVDPFLPISPRRPAATHRERPDSDRDRG
ncbi:MAG TPA: hypothetical protein VMI33_10760 [Streptosporangiaceae bacterium]|nr:hypothetical protein [Streptosporangiaceae bacterium]